MTLPPPESLGNGIHMIRAPLPFDSPPSVNVYLIESSQGLLMIDCGVDWDEGRQAISSGLAALEMDESAVHTLLVSHLHSDHVGMAKRLVEELGCRFVMHERASKLVDVYNDSPGYQERLTALARRHGMPASSIPASTTVVKPDYMPFLDPPDQTVVDGELIDLGDRSLQVLHTPGHEPAHICVRDTRTGVLFSGDHILPRISPVIMYDIGLEDPLGDYLDSLQRIIELGAGLTYPAHGTIVERGDDRARQILLHHERRLVDMAELVAERDTNAWRVMLKSFRPNLDAIQSRLAFLETISHLEHLRITGRTRSNSDEDLIVYCR